MDAAHRATGVESTNSSSSSSSYYYSTTNALTKYHVELEDNPVANMLLEPSL
jgi:hypothetical protein